MKKREINDENNCLIGFLRGQFLDSIAKTRGITLNILKVFLRILTLLIHIRKFKEKKKLLLFRKFKLVKVI